MGLTKWVIFLAMTFVLCSIISGVMEKSYLGENGGSAVIEPFLGTEGDTSWDTFGNVIVLPFKLSTYNALWKMFMWDYAFFTGGYGIFQLVFQCISVGIAIGLVFTTAGLVRGTSV
jgi:hypothetical protein